MSNKNTKKPKVKLIDVLRDLPPEGRRLRGGLALRVTTGNGWHVLGCSRLGVPPSDKEIEILAAAIDDLYRPRWIFESADHYLILDNTDAQHMIRRIYWPAEDLKLARGHYEQADLIGEGGS